jgi:hypothetical protein
LVKHQKVRFLSCPQDCSTFNFPLSWLFKVFRISGQLLWSSVAPMQLGAWRLRRCISRRAPPNRVVFRVARVAKSLGIAFADLFILVECIGGRNRLTSSAIFDR